MTDKEKLSAIRAEIEKLYNNHTAMDSIEGISTTKQLNHLLSFIDSLPEEMTEDLEEAAKEYEQTRYDTDAVSDNEVVRRAFRAGAEWGKKQKVYPVSQDLEEASSEYAEKAYSHPVDRNVGKADFIMGAQWKKQKDDEMLIATHLSGFEEGKKQMKQQMMKGAVDGEVTDDMMIRRLRYDGGEFLKAWDKYKVGDKVKIIILKDE